MRIKTFFFINLLMQNSTKEIASKLQTLYLRKDYKFSNLILYLFVIFIISLSINLSTSFAASPPPPFISTLNGEDENILMTILENLNSGDPEKDFINISLLRKYPFHEVFVEILRRVEFEIFEYKKNPSREFSIPIIVKSLLILRDLSFSMDVQNPIRKIESSGNTPNQNEHHLMRNQLIESDLKLYQLQLRLQTLSKSETATKEWNDLINFLINFLRIAIERQNEPFPSIFRSLESSQIVKPFVSSMPKLPLDDIASPLLRLAHLPPDPNIKLTQEQEILLTSTGTVLDANILDTHDIVEEARQQAFISLLKKKLSQFRETLEENVIGQEELINAVVGIREKDLLSNFRTSPKGFMVIGGTGTGKDTLAAAWAKALHPNDPNWKDHLLELPVIIDDASLDSVLGASSGYIGSESYKTVKILEQLFLHSGGKYRKVLIDKNSPKLGFYYELNPEWSPGMVLEGFYPPESLVVYIPEEHEIPVSIVNSFITLFIERGSVPIKNPSGSKLFTLEVPFNYLIASNHGISLTTSRNPDGTRYKKPLTSEESIALWKVHSINQTTLQQAVLKQDLTSSVHMKKGGTPQLVDRVKIYLAKPHTPEGLRAIANIKMKALQEDLNNLKPQIGRITLTWSEDVTTFLQSYMYNAEENARPIQKKKQTLIEEPLYKAIFDGTLPIDRSPHSYALNVKKNIDGTWNLLVHVDDSPSPVKLFITPTLESKNLEPMSDAEKSHLLTLNSRVKKTVFGWDDTIDQIADAIADQRIENERNPHRLHEPIRLALFGKSSTGKSHLTEVLTEELTGDKDNLVIIKGEELKQPSQFNEMFRGDRDRTSRFVMEYFRKNGKMVVNVDEIMNAHPQAQFELYDFLRKPEVDCWSEGNIVTLSMKNITWLITSNLGEELLNNLPDGLPKLERQLALQNLYQAAISDKSKLREILAKKLTDAFERRIGEHNIVFAPPATFRSIREQFHFKFGQAIESLKPIPGQREGWYLQFESEEDYFKLIDAFEERGFQVEGQGASIHQFINDIFLVNLKTIFYQQKIPYNSHVRIKLSTLDDNGVFCDLFIEGDSLPKTLFLPGKIENRLANRPTDLALVSYHEIGHAIASFVYMGDISSSSEVSMLPGADWIDGNLMYLAGISKTTYTQKMVQTIEAILRTLSVLAAGTVAQELVTLGKREDSGHRSDLQRMTHNIQTAIFRYGLVPEVTREAIDSSVKLEDYIKTLDEKTFKAYRKVLKKFINEARKMAEIAILLNFDKFVELSKKLAANGKLNGKYLTDYLNENNAISERSQEFGALASKLYNGQYRRNEWGLPIYDVDEKDTSFVSIGDSTKSQKEEEKKRKYKEPFTSLFGSFVSPSKSHTRDAVLMHPFLMPENILIIDDYAKDLQKQARDDVDHSGSFSIPLVSTRSPLTTSPVTASTATAQQITTSVIATIQNTTPNKLCNLIVGL